MFEHDGSPTPDSSFTDLGDRHSAYLPSKPSTKPYYNETNISYPRDSDISDILIQGELNAILATLHSAINLDFNRRAGTNNEELFHLPSGHSDYKSLEKVKLIRDLSEQLLQSLQQESMDPESARIFLQGPPSEISVLLQKQKGEGDILSRLFNARQGILIRREECLELSALLIGSARDSSSHDLRTRLGKMQRKYTKMSEALKQTRGRFRSKADEFEKLKDKNIRLLAEIKTMRQQIVSLERQLEDCFVEAYVNEEKARRIREELVESRGIIKQLIGRETMDIDLNLSGSGPRSSRGSNVYFIYSSPRGSLRRSSSGADKELRASQDGYLSS